MVITHVPAWEAAAERLFSILQAAFKKDRVSALLDILDAALAIGMWQVCHAPDEVGPNAPSVLRAQPDLWISLCCDSDSPGEFDGTYLDRARLRLLTKGFSRPPAVQRAMRS
jgi:hypothetical protein